MKRILTGIQSTGVPHLGNLLGAILPTLKMAQESKDPAFIFIADLHTITSLEDPKKRSYFTKSTAAAWLACGLESEKNIFYRQSQVPQVCELSWYLSSSTSYPMMASAHAFKEKKNNLSYVNTALFTYPILMAADILLYDGTHVPVGKDQQQHLEITRDIVQTMNRKYGQDLFTLPQACFSTHTPILLGTDGRKMSKSYQNTINIFSSDQDLRKSIMSIKTDSKPLVAAKDPESCNVFQLYKKVATENEVKKMESLYRAGGYGYGEAKETLFKLLIKRFDKERKKFAYYMDHPILLNSFLEHGETIARKIANKKMDLVRKKLGY